MQVPDPELAPADHLFLLVGHERQHAGEFVVQGGDDGGTGGNAHARIGPEASAHGARAGPERGGTGFAGPLALPPGGDARRRRGVLLLVPQFAPQDLAHRRLGQFGAELDHLGLLVAGEVCAAVGAHLRFGQGRVLLARSPA